MIRLHVATSKISRRRHWRLLLPHIFVTEDFWYIESARSPIRTYTTEEPNGAALGLSYRARRHIHETRVVACPLARPLTLHIAAGSLTDTQKEPHPAQPVPVALHTTTTKSLLLVEVSKSASAATATAAAAEWLVITIVVALFQVEIPPFPPVRIALFFWLEEILPVWVVRVANTPPPSRSAWGPLPVVHRRRGPSRFEVAAMSVEPTLRLVGQ
jgi:hypothetical protein